METYNAFVLEKSKCSGLLVDFQVILLINMSFTCYYFNDRIMRRFELNDDFRNVVGDTDCTGSL